ncbi:HD-GYP domain-containing protein [Lysinibacillus telephonicus]|uniref:HD domain-containing protein n=2 Tax=Lysinibacillus telephonicus TaxID=1714840 RepID=A0A3S0HIX8_9BACI|nr:HD domain-containing phosphohydrolase [Lysinibacillus telephonicus]RTQ91321.1 HD domain-containing protein [Lysinibacillus telephonicus]
MKIIKHENFEYCPIKDLRKGQILYKDLIVENKVLLKKGAILTNRIISKLENRNIQSVCIEKQRIQPIIFDAEATYTNAISSEKKLTNRLKVIQEEFDILLGYLSCETRYGKVLKNIEDISYVNNLFLNYMKNPIFSYYLLKLKDFDEDTYRHMIDVFTLCTLFSKKEGISNIDDIAVGFLFHDIGKLYTPIELIRKKGKLTKKEFLIVQEHTVKGEKILKQIGLEKVAYLAKSHHERVDGSGYPEGLRREGQPKVLQILQLINMYSTITLRRPYKDIVAAAHAIDILYNDLHLYNRELLNSFIDFIGIYPENAVVLLSNGSQAIVEKVNSDYPLLPKVKLFKNNRKMMLPIDLSLTIQKILSYHVNTPKDLLSKFSDFLFSGDYFQMENYHSKLKKYYQKFEWFTHIYLPIFQVFLILKSQNTFPEIKMHQSGDKLLKLVDESLLEFRLSSNKTNKALLIINGLKSPALYKLFEGLLHSDDIYSYIISNPGRALELEKKNDSYSYLIVIGDPLEINLSICTTKYHLTELHLESFLNRFGCTNLQQVKLKKELDKYKQG